MSNPLSVQPSILPVDQLLEDYCNPPTFLINNVRKIAFSPCSKYLAIPKQHIDGQYCVLVIHCSNWHSKNVTDSDLCMHNQFTCTSAIWSLAFGQRTSKLNSITNSILRDKYFLSMPTTRHDSPGRRRSSLSVVNRRYNFTKNLFLAAGLADGKINIWNIDTGELTLILQDHQLAVVGLDFTSCTMQLASCSHDTTIKLWNLLDDGNMYKTLNEWTHVINAVKWSPDETLLCAVGPYELVVLFDTATWTEIFELDGHLHSVVDCAFSSDSALLVTASYDTRVLMWSTVTGEIIKAFAHQIPIPLKIYAGGDNGAFVRSVAITKSNHFLITACDDNKVRWFPLVLDRSSNTIFEQTQSNVLCVATTPDGHTMAVSNRNGEVHLYSTLSTLFTSQPSSLKCLCRLAINTYCGIKRKNIFKLSISRQLINYILYRDIKMK
ncbi:unnamed protein product [Rotaria sp. Silwood2]|nr:unnamed protein product [Rotaria sp. Silwood2]CAF2510907.1 unnamed protein product [Rotaria sp. Silwood2]CAF2743328.1 unnamed protein product [Rotaria sp. Silwood2]CAF2885803.1 unnamed protein product [Rotaria sp. Silwood2]CAF4030725.1 unnamed protein product [Rotaria sp. Silwood2]